ncbi:hypothetical protein [Mitsuokella multacida]|jgi:hypothetical protein|uniref:hypothetical protein n=1 Tax=Mitsuokella multacida TaxID=52226 RepID=UPI0022E1507F|nr:hypothetical protein [Mitsuokella multacida]
MKKQIVDLSAFWEAAAKHRAEEREEERQHIEAVINAALAGVSAVAWEGMAVRGVHHIRVGSALELALLDADGDVIADSEGALLMYDKLILKTWPDDGGLLEIKLERM